MPIRFQYDAAAVVPPSSNELKKYGGQMLMQQRKYDLDQRNDQARISQLGAMRNYNAQPQRVEPSRAEQMQFRDQAIRSGAFDPGVIKNIRDLEQQQRLVMRDRSIDATQRADAMAQLDAQMQIAMSMGYPQQMVEARNQVSRGPRQPITAAQAFASDPKLEDRFMGMVEPTNLDGTPVPYEERLSKAMSMYDTRKKMLFGQPQGQPQQGAPPAGQPQASYFGGSTEAGFGASPVLAQGGFQGSGQSAYQPTGNYTGGEPVFGVQPVLAQQAASQQAAPATPAATPQAAPTATLAKRGARGYVSISPQGQSVTSLGRNAMYNERGEFVGDPGLYDRQGADYIRQQAAGVQPVAQPVSTGKAGFDAAMGNNLDTAYDLANMDRSPGTNFFNPENPAYAAMRAPAPQQNTGNVGQFKGRYGLGGVDYGINPATGNRVTASIRPGGGLEFDEPVGKPGTAMGDRKGSVSWVGGKKKPTATAEVSPGVSTPSQMEAYNALPEAPAAPPATPASVAPDYQYQSPIAQAVANAPAVAAPGSKYGRSSFISPAGREVDAAMQAGEELASREQVAGQQQAFQAMTTPPPAPMSDERRKELGLPTTKELEEMRRSMDQNRTMGGIGLGGTGRAAGSYSPPTQVQKPKETPKAGKQTKTSSQQTGVPQTLVDFASKQPPDVQKAIQEAFDTNLSDRLRRNALAFLLSKGIDLDKIRAGS
jgi:hypothetical protein